MSVNLEGQLVVAISSRALFDFEEENRVFEEGLAHGAAPGFKPDAAYMKLQLERLDVPAKPGVAFSLIKKLLAFNEAPKSLEETLRPEQPKQRVEVVILSRNDPVSGMRVFRSAQHYGLNILRGTFNRGEPPWRYLKPLNANLFLSTHLSDVRAALDAGVPAAQVYPQSAQASLAHPHEVRIAFDGDAVLFPMKPSGFTRRRACRPFSSTNVTRRRSLCWRAPSSLCLKRCIGCSRWAPRACACAPRWSRRAAHRRTSGRYAR